jgi:hypothetical protein
LGDSGKIPDSTGFDRGFAEGAPVEKPVESVNNLSGCIDIPAFFTLYS